MNTETAGTFQSVTDGGSKPVVPADCDWQKVSSEVWRPLEALGAPIIAALSKLVHLNEYESEDGIRHKSQFDGRQKLEQPVRDGSDLPRIFDKLLKLSGSDDVGYLSRSDIERAIGDARFKGEDAQALVALHGNFDRVSALSDDGEGTDSRITRSDIEKFGRLKKAIGPQEIRYEGFMELATAVDEDMRRTRETAGRVVHSLFADKQKPLESIKPEAVEQAGLGNCYFFGAMAALAASDPAALERLIKENDDGTYTVTFPGKKPIRIDSPTDAEFVLFPKPTEYGLWVAVLEKAYGKFCLDDPLYRAWRELRGQKASAIPQEHTDGGSALDAGLRILTGERIGFTFNFQGKDRLHDRLREAFESNPPRPVTADCSFNVRVGNGSPVSMHTYSVLSYDGQKREIVLRNPWGHTVPNLDGVKDLGNGKFRMKLDDFADRFTRIAYTRP